MISGIHASSARSIAYFDVENINMSLGTVAANVNVFSTAQNAALVLATGGKFGRAFMIFDQDKSFQHSFFASSKTPMM